MPAVESGSSVDAPPAEARRARIVTYALVGVLLAAAAVQVDAWPVSAYRLFSSLRTADGVSLTLWAVGQDGERTNLRPTGSEVLATTTHQYRELGEADPARQREMVDAWLGLAGIAPSEVSEVVLERGGWRMDAATRDTQPTGTDVVAVVAP